MRIVRLIFVSILVFLIIITLISLFIPSHVQVANAIQLNAEKDSVMALLKTPANWRRWYPGGNSAELVVNKGTPDGLVLDRDKKRSIVFVSANNNEVNASFINGDRRIPTGWQVAYDPNSRQVTVVWHIDFYLRWYPWEKFTSFMFEKVYKPQMEEGLQNLKKVVER